MDYNKNLDSSMKTAAAVVMILIHWHKILQKTNVWCNYTMQKLNHLTGKMNLERI